MSHLQDSDGRGARGTGAAVLILTVPAILLGWPAAMSSAQDLRPDPDQDVLFVDVLSRSDARVGKGFLPLLYQERLPRSFEELRHWLHRDADPRRYPATRLPDGTAMPPFPEAAGVPPFPSSRILRVRSSLERPFGWVLALMQVSTVVPGRDYLEELRRSPLLWRIELGVLGTDAWVPVYLPRDRPLAGRPPPEEAEIRLEVVPGSPAGTDLSAPVVLSGRGCSEPFGHVTGWKAGEAAPERPGLALEPADTLERTTTWLRGLRERRVDAAMKMRADPRVPLACVWEILQRIREAGYPRITFSGTPEDVLDQLERGVLR